MNNMCKKCGKLCGWLLLGAGVLFLLRDWSVWNFWNIQWWTLAFLLAGLAGVGRACCPDCNACCDMDESPKKKKK